MVRRENDLPPDYVVIGHLSRDLVDGQERTGGTVLYAGVTAMRLGRRVAILTAAADPLPIDLRGIDVEVIASDTTTTFELDFSGGGRSVRALRRGAPITATAIPSAWRAASLVHLAPIVGEMPVDLADEFPNSVVTATPQGWLGRWKALDLSEAEEEVTSWLAHPRISAAVFSVEDTPEASTLAQDLARQGRVVVLTEGTRGYSLFLGGEPRHFASFPAHEVDSTGAGDVFAAAFFVRLSETGSPEASARFAAAAAARSVEGLGVSRIPTRAEVMKRLEAEPQA